MENNSVEINTGGGSISLTSSALGISNEVTTLGNVSAVVSQTLSQLPTSVDSNKPNLKQLFEELHLAIVESTELSNEDRVDLLEQVKLMAESIQGDVEVEKEGILRRSKKIFDATLKGLPAGAQIVNACNNLLPAIFKIISSS